MDFNSSSAEVFFKKYLFLYLIVCVQSAQSDPLSIVLDLAHGLRTVEPSLALNMPSQFVVFYDLFKIVAHPLSFQK